MLFRNQYSRPALLQMALGAFAVLVIAKSAYLQLWRGDDLARRAVRQYYRTDTIPAARGDLLDAEGRPLVVSVEYLNLAIAPREIRPPKPGRNDREILARTLTKLRVSPEIRRRALAARGEARWVTIPGRPCLGATQRAADCS